MKTHLLPWLLEPSNPGARSFALCDQLGRPEDGLEVCQGSDYDPWASAGDFGHTALCLAPPELCRDLHVRLPWTGRLVRYF
ncbi:MAG: hypothetical protein KJ077_28050 [Anaerolineae bacterium]|nr:hypothetical protein [Anaerolineae bacterium]